MDIRTMYSTDLPLAIGEVDDIGGGCVGCGDVACPQVCKRRWKFPPAPASSSGTHRAGGRGHLPAAALVGADRGHLPTDTLDDAGRGHYLPSDALGLAGRFPSEWVGGRRGHSLGECEGDVWERAPIPCTGATRPDISVGDPGVACVSSSASAYGVGSHATFVEVAPPPCPTRRAD